MGRLPILTLIPLLFGCDDTLFGPQRDESYTADWTGVSALLADRCLRCHGAGDDVVLPDAIVADLASGAGEYVVPSDPDASLLWRVLSGDLGPDDYATMPLGDGPLPAETIEPVREWIAGGAPIDVVIDWDGDGWLSDVDCDDTDAAVHPEADERCNLVDDDCDDAVDDAAIDSPEWYADDAHDGFGSGTAVRSCTAPAGFVALPGDCDDADDRRHPGANETCGAQEDLNCDGSFGLDDHDGDGFAACEECNDADAGAFPGAPESCNDRDDDCDGSFDEDAVDATTWYPDTDGDSFGWDPGAETTCDPPTDAVIANGDCLDSDASVNPGTTGDPTDGLDNDCDGDVDEDGVVLSHATDIQPIWNAHCTTCHDPPVPSGGLDLSGNGWDDLVEVPSDDVPSMFRVDPGDPSESYLWHKLNGTQAAVGGTGNRMPKTGPLDPASLALVRSWILGGANP